MNWFERYAIPGIYFVSLLAALYWIFFGFQFNGSTNFAVFGAILSVSLPADYILSIISQRIHYWTPQSWQLHRDAWLRARNNQSELNTMSEEIIEAEVSVLGRWKIECEKTDKGRWLQEWFGKRMDVLAINLTFIVATIVVWILGILVFLLQILISHITPPECCYLLILFMMTFLIVTGIISSTKLLNRQVKHALIKFYTNLQNKDKGMLPNNG